MSNWIENLSKKEPTPEDVRILGIQSLFFIVVMGLHGITFVLGTPVSQGNREILTVFFCLGLIITLSCVYNMLKEFSVDKFWKRNWAFLVCGGLGIHMLIICAKIIF